MSRRTAAVVMSRTTAAKVAPSRRSPAKVEPSCRSSATVDHFGRILIPKAIREAAGLTEGTAVEMVVDARGLRLVPRQEGAVLREKEGVLVITGEILGDVTTAVDRDREERLRSLGGG